MKKIHLIHHNDADGYASAATILKYFVFKYDECDEYEILTSSYNYDADIDTSMIEKGDIVFILDYSFSRENDVTNFVELLNEGGVEIIWIDHHTSSKNAIKNNSDLCLMSKCGFVNTDNKYSSCMLAYVWALFHSIKDGNIDYSRQEILPDVIDVIAQMAPAWISLISDYDTFTKDIPYSKEFCLGLNSENLYDVFLNMESANFVTRLDESSEMESVIADYIDKGNTIRNYLKVKNEKILKDNGAIFTIKMSGDTCDKTFEVLALNIASGNSSTFGKYFDKFAAVVRYNQTSSGKWYHSVYSTEDSLIECDELAELMKDTYHLSGGGHKHDSTFITPEPIFVDNKSEDDSTLLITKVMSFKEYLELEENKEN